MQQKENKAQDKLQKKKSFDGQDIICTYKSLPVFSLDAMGNNITVSLEGNWRGYLGHPFAVLEAPVIYMYMARSQLLLLWPQQWSSLSQFIYNPRVLIEAIWKVLIETGVNLFH